MYKKYIPEINPQNLKFRVGIEFAKVLKFP